VMGTKLPSTTIVQKVSYDYGDCGCSQEVVLLAFVSTHIETVSTVSTDT